MVKERLSDYRFIDNLRVNSEAGEKGTELRLAAFGEISRELLPQEKEARENSR